MCVIIYKPKDKIVTPDILKACDSANSDGIGFMYSYKGHLKVKRNYGFSDFMCQYEEALEGEAKNSPIVLHFRLGTSGERGITNVHPFRVNSNYGFCHNGMFSGLGTDVKWCDTALFAKKYLDKLPLDFAKNESILNLVTEAVGYTNKVVLMDNNGAVYMIGGKNWYKEDGLIFSNNYWKRWMFKDTWGYCMSCHQTAFLVDIGGDYEVCPQCKSMYGQAHKGVV